MKKLKVITENCIGCGACVGIDPEHFDFNDEGFSVVKSNDNLDSKELIEAIEECPVAIISLEETNEKCQCDNCQCEDCDCGDDCHCVDCHDEEAA